MDQDNKKEWQFGYDIEYLRGIETNQFSHYNSFTYSPFTKYKKNDIARDLHEGKLFLFSNEEEHFGFVEEKVKVKTPITCYHDVVIGYKYPGDIIYSKLFGEPKYLKNFHLRNLSSPSYVYTWTEDPTYNKMLFDLDYQYIGGKSVTSSELISIWFRDVFSENIYGEKVGTRPLIKPDTIEKITLKKLGYVNLELIESIKTKLENLNLTFVKSDLTAYVNKDWSALALRGYSSDPYFIADPNEMSKKWNEKHLGPFMLQDTSLFDEFPMIREMLESLFPDCEYHRITFMRMKPNGVLQRHTDQIDWNHGLANGKLVRFHFPIKTNSNVKFLAWELNGNILEYYMRPGEVWVLDTRKPHKVICNSDEERIHLTVDLRVNENIRNYMLNETI